MNNENWTPDQIKDLTGKVILVTGANSGIGFEASKVFADKGATVILACRNTTSGQNAKNEIAQAVPHAKTELISLDLSSQKSVHTFAKTVKEKYNQLDVLVNNAGIMMPPYQTTEDGFESQLGINHLGHFALTGLLFEELVNTENARVVNISSNAHKQGKMDFDNLMFEDGVGYSRMAAYGRSKLANLLFTLELQGKFKEKGVSAIAVAAHPGVSNTNLAKHLEDKLVFRLLKPLFSVMTHSPAQASWPTLRAATDPKTQGGDYYGPDGFMEMKGKPKRVNTNNAAKNVNDAKKLWEVSESLTNVHYH